MKAGMLRTPITIQLRATGTDAAGQPVETWTDFATDWAQVLGSTGMGAIRNQEGVGVSVSGYSFRVRFREDVHAGMRVVSGGVAYEILTTRLDLHRREWTDIVCERGGSNG